MTLSTVTPHSYTVLGLAPGDFATYLACGVAVVAAFVASLQATRATRQSSYSSIASMLQDMNRIFLENPSLRPYFFKNPPPPGPTDTDDQEKVEAITFYLLNLYEAIWSFKPQMEEKNERRGAITSKNNLQQVQVCVPSMMRNLTFIPISSRR